LRKGAKELLLELEARRRAGDFTGKVAGSYPLSRHTTYKLGGAAEVYVQPESERDLAILREALLHFSGMNVTVLGRGSNVLIADAGINGVVIRLGEGFNYFNELSDRSGVKAGGVVALPMLARWAGERGYLGLEFGVGIPASVGGAVRMNAGGHGSEIKEVLASARVFDLDSGPKDIEVADLGLAYRTSKLSPLEIVIEATFSLGRGDPDEIRERMNEISRWRRDNQPGGIPSAGSVFKNPPGNSAGRLIDEAGCKGMRVGGAEVSSKHANFFVASEGAKSSDVVALMVMVRRRVFDRFGVLLEPEIRLVGDFGDIAAELWSTRPKLG